jgi:molybdopterin synthase catalytic subunit
MNARFLLSPAVLDEQSAVNALSLAGAGAVVTFVGRVRGDSRGRSVEKLEYDAYPEMAELVFERIAREIRAEFDIVDIAIHHRVGTLAVGEISVVIAVSAAHRPAAFDACRHAIDALKRIAPIWKKEFAADGATWVEDRP